MSKFHSITYALITLAAGLSSCNTGYESTDTGLKYKLHTENTGKRAAIGDIMVVNMVATTDDDSTIIDSYKEMQPINIQVRESAFKGSLDEGFVMLTKGDSATFVVNADSLYSKTFNMERPPFIKAGSNVTFHIKVMDVFNQADLKKKGEEERAKAMKDEEPARANYVAGLKDVKSTPSGLQYTVVKTNSGRQAKNGDSVSVHYTGKLLNGKVFDSSVDRGEPISFTLGQGNVIPGWDEGIALMKEGEKYHLIIPSTLAYGPTGAGNVIPPYSTLIFDVELVKIHNK